MPYPIQFMSSDPWGGEASHDAGTGFLSDLAFPAYLRCGLRQVSAGSTGLRWCLETCVTLSNKIRHPAMLNDNFLAPYCIFTNRTNGKGKAWV